MKLGHAPQQQNQFGSGPGPHGVTTIYDNVTFTVTGRQITLTIKVKGQADVVITVNKDTGEIE